MQIGSVNKAQIPLRWFRNEDELCRTVTVKISLTELHSTRQVILIALKTTHSVDTSLTSSIW